MYCFTPRLMFSSRSSAPDRTYMRTRPCSSTRPCCLARPLPSCPPRVAPPFVPSSRPASSCPRPAPPRPNCAYAPCSDPPVFFYPSVLPCASSSVVCSPSPSVRKFLPSFLRGGPSSHSAPPRGASGFLSVFSSPLSVFSPSRLPHSCVSCPSTTCPNHTSHCSESIQCELSRRLLPTPRSTPAGTAAPGTLLLRSTPLAPRARAIRPMPAPHTRHCPAASTPRASRPRCPLRALLLPHPPLPARFPYPPVLCCQPPPPPVRASQTPPDPPDPPGPSRPPSGRPDRSPPLVSGFATPPRCCAIYRVPTE